VDQLLRHRERTIELGNVESGNSSRTSSRRMATVPDGRAELAVIRGTEGVVHEFALMRWSLLIRPPMARTTMNIDDWSTAKSHIGAAHSERGVVRD